MKTQISLVYPTFVVHNDFLAQFTMAQVSPTLVPSHSNPFSWASLLRNAFYLAGSVAALFAVFQLDSSRVSNYKHSVDLHSRVDRMERSVNAQFENLNNAITTDAFEHAQAFSKLEEMLIGIRAIFDPKTESISKIEAQKPEHTTPHKTNPELTENEKEIIEIMLGYCGNRTEQFQRNLIFDSFDEDSSAAWYFIAGSLLKERGEVEPALDFILTAADKFPHFQRAYQDAGEIQMQLHDYQAAKTNLLRAESLSEYPGSKTSGLLGDAYFYTSDPISAERHYRNALALDPHSNDW